MTDEEAKAGKEERKAKKSAADKIFMRIEFIGDLFLLKHTLCFLGCIVLRWTHLSRQFLEIFKLHFGV